MTLLSPIYDLRQNLQAGRPRANIDPSNSVCFLLCLTGNIAQRRRLLRPRNSDWYTPGICYGHPPPGKPAPVNANEPITICYVMRLYETAFRSHLQRDREATASPRPEQLLEEEGSTPLNIITAFWNGGIVGEWNAETNVLVCKVDWVAASQRRRWNRSKGRVNT
jgi:hypothetical protein